MKKKKIIRIVGIIVGILLIALIVAGLLFSNNVGKQVAEGIVYENDGLDTKQNSINQLADWGYDQAAFEATYTAGTPITMTAEDGNVIPAVVFPIKDSDKTAILVHGLGGDHVCMEPISEIYLKNGYQVIVIDQRASGDSQNKLVTFGVFESLDVAAAVDYAKKEMFSNYVLVHGQSMGAATAALYSVTDHAKENVDTIILESCFDSMENMFLGLWREMDGTDGIPENYIISCGNWYLKQHFGFEFKDADIEEKLKQDSIPTLMIQATSDDLIPNETAKKIFSNIIAEKKDICYFDCEHIENGIKYPEEYEKDIMNFLMR